MRVIEDAKTVEEDRYKLTEPGEPPDLHRDESSRVGDITYIRLRADLAYLAVMLDAYSRKVVG